MENQLQVILMVGAPGSGKSTFAKNFFKKNLNFKYLSSDALRAELGKGEDDQSVTPLVFSTLKNRLHHCLRRNESVIIDATNMNLKDRRDYIVAAQTFGAKIAAYVFLCDKQTLLERNKKRGAGGGRNVPEFVIDKMIAKYQAPTTQEGFDEIHFIK
jgi:protein phosphatase